MSCLGVPFHYVSTEDPPKKIITVLNWTNVSDLLEERFNEKELFNAHSWAMSYEECETFSFHVDFQITISFRNDRIRKTMVIYDSEIRRKTYNTYWWDFLKVKRKYANL